MVAEFGEPGVENPKLMDLITVDKAANKVVLVMYEKRPWGASPQQFAQIEEKLNRYMGYVLEGFLAEQHPEHIGKAVQIRIDCVEAPHGEAVKFVRAAAHACAEHGLELVANVTSFEGGAAAAAPPPSKPEVP